MSYTGPNSHLWVANKLTDPQFWSADHNVLEGDMQIFTAVVNKAIFLGIFLATMVKVAWK